MDRSDGRAQPAASSGSSTHRRTARVGGYLVGVSVVLLLTAAVVTLGPWLRTHARTTEEGRSDPVAVPAEWVRPAVTQAGLVDLSGVRVVQVAVTGGGGLVDLRFQVIDPNKAVALHEVTTPPAVVDERSGLVVNELLMGHDGAMTYKPGVTYYLLFENPGNLIHPGSTVSVLLGDAQLTNVPVR